MALLVIHIIQPTRASPSVPRDFRFWNAEHAAGYGDIAAFLHGHVAARLPFVDFRRNYTRIRSWLYLLSGYRCKRMFDNLRNKL